MTELSSLDDRSTCCPACDGESRECAACLGTDLAVVQTARQEATRYRALLGDLPAEDQERAVKIGKAVIAALSRYKPHYQLYMLHVYGAVPDAFISNLCAALYKVMK